MQKILLALSISMILFIGQGYAQTSASQSFASVTIPEIGLPGTSKSVSGTINNRALKNFRKTIKSDGEERWYTTKDGSFVVKYEKEGIQCRSDYDRKGNWQSTTRYYGENLLPKDIRSMVKSVYYDFKITRIQEITLDGYLVYIVHMEGEDSWVNLNICNGDMNVMESFTKR